MAASSAKTPSPAKAKNVIRLFDARPDRLDFRDLPYRPPLRSLPPRYPLEPDVERLIGDYVGQGLILDQGSEGACTGFGLAGVANYLLWTRHVEDQVKVPFIPVSPRMFYELAKRYDEWPGIDYDGSSCRGALKGWHKHGVCSRPMWPYELNDKGDPVFVRPQDGWDLDAARRPLGVYYRVSRDSVVDIQAAIFNIGAVYVSANAHDGWDALLRDKPSAAPKRHDDLPSIGPIRSKKSSGGHAFALVGFNDRGFIVQNSWNTVWGACGFAVLPYEDWVANATDVWACALGVPLALRDARSQRTQPLVSSRSRVGSGRSLTTLQRDARDPDNPANDPWPIDHHFNFKAYQPWTTDVAYAHTLVTGNDGELVAVDFTRDAADTAGLAEEVVRTRPQAWLARQGGKVLKLAVYAHGGLNSEDDSIKRIRVLGPCFDANGIYPLFLTWKTGPGETIADMAQDWVRKIVGEEAAGSSALLDALGDAKDRAVEATAHVFGKGIWSEMRENAERATAPGHGLNLLLANLAGLQSDLQAAGKRLELHLVGHSAGSILLGHFVRQLTIPVPALGQAALPIATTSLYAAACSSAFANQTYAAAAKAGVFELSKLWLYVLSDGNEKDDGLPTSKLAAYGKSLLYLVSRALDDVRKMPLLGMERALLSKYARDSDQWDEDQLLEVRRWQAVWPAGNPLLVTIDTPQVINTREKDHIQATHGSFDNNIAVLTETIARIRGTPLASDLEWLDY
jgi:hypothetical protein